MEKEQAKEKYQDKISKGHTVAMAKQKKDSDLLVSIGNLQPQQCVFIDIHLSFPMQSESGYWRYSLPSGFIPNSHLSPEVPQASGVTLEMNITAISEFPILDYSSNWPLISNLAVDTIVATFDQSSSEIPTEEFWFKYRASVIAPSCLIQRLGDKYAAMLSFIPYCAPGESVEDLESTAEYLVILDRSGSMENRRIALAKQAAIFFLKSLPSQSKFNIISFGTNFSLMHPESVLANSETVNHSIAILSSYTADMGGTNIYGPLEHVFKQAISNDYPRFIFLITDGDVSDTESVIGLIKKNSAFCRISAFGIEDANPNLIYKAAEAGRGEAYIIKKAEEIGKCVIDSLSKCMVPCILDFQVDWEADCVPSNRNIGILKYGERFIQYSIMDHISTTRPVLKFFDTYAHKQLEYSISLQQEIPGDQIFKLWAKNKIQDMISESMPKESIIKISTEFKVPSPYTAFICVKKNLESSAGDMETVHIPIFESIRGGFEKVMNYLGKKKPLNYVPGGFSSDSSSSSERMVMLCGRPPGQLIGGINSPSVPSNHMGIYVMARGHIGGKSSSSSSSDSFSQKRKNSPKAVISAKPRQYLGNSSSSSSSNSSMKKGKTSFTAIKCSIPVAAIKSSNPSTKVQMGIPKPLEDVLAPTKLLKAKDSSSSDSSNSSEEESKDANLLLFEAKAKSNSKSSDLAPVVLKSAPKPLERSGNAKSKPECIDIVLLQSSEGFWTWLDLAQLIPKLELIRDTLEVLESNLNENATAYALLYLSTYFISNRDEWMLVERKGLRWLKQHHFDFEKFSREAASVILESR